MSESSRQADQRAAAHALAARQGHALVDLSQRTRLAVVGPDRLSWLQGMVTNDVSNLAVGQGCAATALTSKGKLVADLRIYLRPQEIWLDAHGSRRHPLLEHLSHYIIMEDCALEDRSETLTSLAVVGPHAFATVSKLFPTLVPDAPDHSQREVSAAAAALAAVAIQWHELGLPGFALWVASEVGPLAHNALRGLGIADLSPAATEVLRIEAGRPREGAELDESVIPLEGRLDHQISDTKGCYLGQEVIARISHRGHVNRKLTGLLLSGDVPPLPASLTAEGKAAGELRSAVYSEVCQAVIGLGYVRRELADPGHRLELPGGESATTANLPFV